jgi:RNA polymerase sigma-70 factor, ECF subfamily
MLARETGGKGGTGETRQETNRSTSRLSRMSRASRATFSGAAGLFQPPAKTYILLPRASVECYSRGGHEVDSVFLSHLARVMDKPSQLTTSMIDPNLLALVAKGDQQAFSQLYDHSSTLLFTLAVRILGNREEAAELLQDVYLEVWRKVSRYDVGRGTPVAWLITLTKSRAIDRLRARATRGYRATNSLEAGTAMQVADPSPSPLETQANQELRLAVGTAVAGLPQAQQQAIELAYYEGLSHAEIAQRLNQPLGTVKTRIKLGMSKLRDGLQQWGNHGDLQ